MYSKRVMELQSSLKAFEKSTYHKSEILPELLKLQKEMVELTFSEDHATTADLRLYDVERHLQALNEERGHVADEELRDFMNDCKVVCNMIRAEISGNKGEYRAFKNLEYLRKKNIILRNVELSEGELRTELDAVVINSAGITIVEVKNTGKDIHIDAKGDYYTTGEFLRLDCNIAEKMSVKEELLANTVSQIGVEEVSIQSVVVFTNSHIEVHNECKQVKTCFVSTLNRTIDDFRSGQYLDDDAMLQISSAIEAAANKEFYPLDFDVMQFKKDFAIVMAILEEAPAQKEGSTEAVIEANGAEAVIVESDLNDARRVMADKNYVRHTLTEDDAKSCTKRKAHSYMKQVAAVAAIFGLGLVFGRFVGK